MKNSKTNTIFLVWIICLIGVLNCNVLKVSAETTEDGYEYSILEDGTVKITGYPGYEGDVMQLVIPGVLEGKTVTRIGNEAFYYCPGLTSIEIPSSVVSIGDFAFARCTGLTSIEIPSSVTSIGKAPFIGCTNLIDINVDSENKVFNSDNECNAIIETDSRRLIQGCQNTNIPSDVEHIGWYAFASCSGLTNIELPSQLVNVGDYAFYGCSGLTNIELPSQLVNVGDYAFYGCSGLTNIEIPSYVERIGEYAFEDCSKLTGVEISSLAYLQTIGDRAFNNCSSLREITIPSSVTYIGMLAFANCAELTSIEIPSSVTYIGVRAFEDCLTTMVVYADAGSVAAQYAEDAGFTVKPIAGSSGGEEEKDETTEEKVTEVPTFDKKMKSKIDVSDYTKGVNLGKDTIHGPKLNILGKEVELFSLSANVELNIADKVTYCQNTDEKTIEVLIGVESKDGKVDFSDEANSDRYWKETYKQVKSIYTVLTGNKKTKKLYNDFRSLRKKLHSTNSTLLVKGEVKSVIFLKYSYATGELELVEGGGLVSAELEADVKKKIPQFPVAYITVGASASGQVSFNVVPAWSGEIGIDLALKAGAGIDLKYANIEGGAKVTLSNTLQLPASSIEEALSVKVNGKGYLKAKAFGKTLANASKDFVNLSIYPELSLQTMNLVEPQVFKSSISSGEDEATYMKTMALQEVSGEVELLKTDLYPDCAPVLVELGNNQYLLVWVDDNGTKDTYNNTSLLYSYFNGSEWSAPAVIVENAYLNDYPVVCSKDGTAYILWQQLVQTCDSETTYEEMLSYSDLYYITFTEGTFSEPIAVTTDNAVYEMQQQIYATDDEVYSVWVENSANDPFMGDGENNTIYMRELSDENSESTVIAENLSAVTNLTIGEIEGVLSVAYTDGTYGYLYQNGESVQLNDGEDIVRNIQITDGIMYAGRNDSLCVYEEGEFSDTGLAFSGDYTVLSEGNRIISNVYEGGPSKLVLFSKLDEGWNNGVVLTDETKYIRDYQIVEEEDGTLKSVICEVDVDLDAEDIYGTANLLVKDLSADVDIELLDTVYTDKDNPVQGEELTFSYEISNNGEEIINGYTISLVDSDGAVIGEKTVETEVDGGITKEGEVTFVMPDDIALENYELVINSGSDVVSSNNSVEVTLGYSDLSIIDCQMSQDGILSGKIVNEGYADAQNVIVKVYKDSIDTAPIKEMSFDVITSGEILDISTTFSENEMVVPEDSLGTTWILEVETESEESGYGNNTTVIFLYRELELEISENVEVKQGDSVQVAFRDVLTNEDFWDKVVWSSEDEKIAVVSETGEVKGIGVGDTEVYAVFDDEVYVCKVSVKTTQESNEQSSSTQQPTTEEQSGENSQTTEDTSTTQESNKTKGLPKVGTKVATSSAEYKVTKSSTKTKEVTFIKPKSSKKKSITVPEAVTINGYTYKVTAIANKAFKNNKKLKSVTIGKNVKKIGKEAFYNCKKLKKITIKSAVLKSVGKNAIKGIYKKATIKVPKKQLKKYKKLFKSKTGYKKTMKIKK